ncbi:Tho2 domain-containing protein/Thoc2 domain-containing protein [Cephalotus follicularis]|uniref:THO complex subunit 2 n=1 Tax=Cephalotus follicularis TaxID=3775 RepID=A0A1Q3C1S6_CEPFO|nr:Tho2 domain-containing protein/Thoc2 domain-containing protein [Cephalotus follicularis]
MGLPPIEYLYVTEESLREWKNGNPNFRVPSPVNMLRFLYELCSSVVRGELPITKCKAALESVMYFNRVSDDELASFFADIVTQMALDLTMPGEYRSRLIKLAKWLVESALVPLRHFHERSEEEFLWEAEMIKIKAQDLKNKEVRVNTRLLYQQTKFNLLREESEGYAKLVTLLCQGSEDSTQNATAAKIGVIKSLIGHFDLDPNRVFDIVLECFELQPDNTAFLELIPIFPKSHASQILGFKFQYYQRMEVNRPVPFGLYKLTALLVKEEFIDLDSIYSHLLPKDEDAFEHYNAFLGKRLDEANKIGKINLAATGKDLMDDEKQGDVTVDLFAALDMETEAVAERLPELENNQTLGLLLGFLYVGDWYHASILFDRLSPLNPVGHFQICDDLFRLIEKTIASAYRMVREVHLQGFGSASDALFDHMETVSSSLRRSFIDLPKELFQMLATAGAYLYRDALLLQKVCRVLRGYYLSALEMVGGGGSESVIDGNRVPRLLLKEARSRVEEALGACLLPSLQLIPANPAVGQEIWEVMNLFPYEVRYRLYGEWEKDDERNPMVLAARQTAKLDTRWILKRLAKENLKQLGRMVAKLAHANPMTVLRTIVHQIEAYRDMITPVVDAFKYLTQLEYDALEYVVIERLVQGGRDKLKDDGLNLSDWLQSLASFWGHLCKKYPSMELRGLFQYLVNQLKKGQGIELVLLQELIQQMANVQYTENLTEEQLDSMAGSDTLRYQATSFGVARNNKALIKSSNRLRDSLLPKDEPKLAIPLLLLIAQHRSVVVINADAPYIKMVSEQFDRCQCTLLQYVEFLCSAVTPTTAYAQLIPSLNDLVQLYHLDPEVAFLIYRPVMRLFKCQGSSDDIFWPLDPNEGANIAIESEPTEDNGKMIADFGSPQKPIMWSDLLDTVKTMLPSKAWNSLSPDLYATFWGLTLYDLHAPRNRYESEIAKQHAALKALEELSDNSSSAIMKRKKDKERIQESLDRLVSELRRHEENVASVRKRLSREKDKWLSSCPDTLKINMEFLQRCIFPRCTFSMPDAVYCAMFVHTLHSLGTPFFNTVNHIDVLICKTLQPMICCCTEYEVGRLGRFLYETLKIAYYWKSDESIYERECGNMPGFAVYYRYPNSQRVTYGQFIKVHWKWSQRITRLLIQCLESTEYMEIRNALIMLTKISGVFPVTRKSGINLEKRVAKIKSDEREDLKVLATGVAAALAARKPSWVTDEEFGMGYLELKPAPALAPKSLGGSMVGTQNGPFLNASQSEPAGGRTAGTVTQHSDSGNSGKDHISRTKPADGRLERTESIPPVKSDQGHVKLKGDPSVNGSDIPSSVPSASYQAGTSRSVEYQKQADESVIITLDDSMVKAAAKNSESEFKASGKRSVPTGSLNKNLKQDIVKDDGKSGKVVGRTTSNSDRDVSSHTFEGRHVGAAIVSSGATANGNIVSATAKGSTPSTRMIDIYGSESKADTGMTKCSDLRFSVEKDEGPEASEAPRPSSSRIVHSLRHDNSTTKLSDKIIRRISPAEESDRLNKRRKGDAESKDLDSEVRVSDREKSMDPRLDLEKIGAEEQSTYRAIDKPLERSKDKGNERYDRDHRERVDRPDKSRGDDLVTERSRDRSMERHARDRSVERAQERGIDRSFERPIDKSKEERSRDDRSKLRYADASLDKPFVDDRFHGQTLPPPPPLPPHMVPQTVTASRRDEDADRRFGSRHGQRLSPRHDEKERRRSEENSLSSQDDAKRRRDDDFRDRKREDRDGLSMKVEERERDRDREKANIVKEDIDASTAKRRKLKREHMLSGEAGEYSPVAPPPPSLSVGVSQSYDGRDRGDRKGALIQHAGYLEEPGMKIHGKEVASKVARRDTEQMYDREWDEDKRQRAEQKRRHRK